MNKSKPIDKKYVILLFVNTILLLVLYLVAVNFFALATFIVYTVVTAGFSFSYVIYNRAFTRKNLKYEDLPSDWSPDKRNDFLEDGRRRLEKSKWMLTVIIPLIVIYGYELISIYVVPLAEELLKNVSI